MSIKRMTLPLNDPRHGTMNAYSKHKCRCLYCRRCAAEYAETRKRFGGNGQPRGRRKTQDHDDAIDSLLEVLKG